MRIGVIGVGRLGGTLAKYLAEAGHEVVIANSRGSESLAVMSDRLGCLVNARSVRVAANVADVAVVSIPFGRFRELPVAELSGKPVIDTMNYHPDRDGDLRELDDGSTTSSELLQAHLAGAHVVKAFNAIEAEQLRAQAYRGHPLGRRAVPVSGDNVNAKKSTVALIDEIGFEAVDVGGLADGRKYQPGTAVYAADLTAADLRARLHHAT